MKLEYLYPELGNLFGDSGNMRYLRQSLPEADYIETHIGSEPAFAADNEVVFLYTGPMTERGQNIALEALRPYAAALRDRIENGMYGLFTGNSMELLGCSITADGVTREGLGLVDLRANCDTASRTNGFFLGDAGGIEITAFNSRFSHSTPGPSLTPFAQVTRGIGMEPGCSFEGYRYGNLIGTYLLGPLLVLNPLFTIQLLRSLGTDREPAFFNASYAAYEVRLAEFKDKKRKLDG